MMEGTHQAFESSFLNGTSQEVVFVVDDSFYFSSNNINEREK